MPNTVSKTVSKKPKINPFCTAPQYEQIKFEDTKYCFRYVDGEFTEDHRYVPGIEKYDSQAEIDACKELAGVDYMKTQLKLGLAKPEDFYDDGQHGVDLSQLPANVHEALAESQKIGSEVSEIAKIIGVPEGEVLTGAQFEKYLTDFITKKWQEQQAQAVAPTEGDK